jgi:hypothetical protein
MPPQIMDLDPGQALIFSSQHLVEAAYESNASKTAMAASSSGLAGGSEQHPEPLSRKSSRCNHVFKVQIRPRITADRGGTKTNVLK